MKKDKANAKISKAFEAYRKSEEAYRKLCEETFVPGTQVAWLINAANGKYRQFGTVIDVYFGTIRVRNNRTGNVIRMHMDSTNSYKFEKWSADGGEVDSNGS